MAYTPKTVLLITWPESQRIMEHPEALLVDSEQEEGAYIVPPEVWEQYKNTYYTATLSLEERIQDEEEREREDCEENGLMCTSCGDYYSEDNIGYCEECNCVVCDECYNIVGGEQVAHVYCTYCVPREARCQARQTKRK